MKIQTAILLIAGIVALASGAPRASRTELDKRLNSFPQFLVGRVDQISKGTSDIVEETGKIFKMAMDELEWIDKQLEAAKGEIQNLKAKNAELANQLEGAKAKIKDLEDQVKNFKNQIAALKADLATANGKITDLQKKIQSLKDDIIALRTEIGNLKTEIAAKDKKIGELETKVGSQKKTIAAQEESIKKLNEEVTGQRNTIATKDKEIGELKIALESCQREKLPIIPEGYELVGNHYVKYFDQKKFWVDAKAACKEDGAQLVTVEDDETIEWIKGVGNPVGRPVWTGANDRAEEGKWVWDDSKPVVNIPWGAGEPNSGMGLDLNEDCGLANYSEFVWSNPGKIADAICETRFHFVCEIPKRT